MACHRPCSEPQPASLENIIVKLYKRVTFIEACYAIFFNEIIEYDIANEEMA